MRLLDCPSCSVDSVDVSFSVLLLLYKVAPLKEALAPIATFTGGVFRIAL
jgi:hypothetical protein